MFRWYVINTYSGHENKVKQNLEHRVVSLSQQRAVRQVVVPTETVQELKDNQKVSVEKRTMPGYVLVNMDLNEDSLVAGQEHARRHRLRRRDQRADPAHADRGRPAAAPRGRGPRAEPRPVHDRGDRQGHLRPPVRLLRRDRRDQRGRRAPQGPRVDLRPRDPRRGRLRPGEEGLTTWRRRSSPRSSCRPRAGRRRRLRRSAPRSASTASTSWSSSRRSTPRPPTTWGRRSRSRSRSTRTARSPSSPRRRRPRCSSARRSASRRARASRTAPRSGRSARDQLRAIAEKKLDDLNAHDVDQAEKIIAGTARSMGVEVTA